MLVPTMMGAAALVGPGAATAHAQEPLEEELVGEPVVTDTAAAPQEPVDEELAGEPVATDTARSVTIGAIEVAGVTGEGVADVLARARLRAGEAVDYRDIQRAIRRLWATGEYRDIEVYAETPAGGLAEASGPVRMIIRVEPRPHVAAIEFRGLEHIDASTVRDTVGLAAGGPLRPSEVAAAEAMVKRLLADKGYRVLSVDHHLEEIAGQPGMQRLVFDVEEGHRVAIADIAFEGNRVFSDAELRDAMDADAEGFFWFQEGTYDPGTVRRDFRETLPAFYGRHGYIDFAVVDDTLVVDPETGKARLVVDVREGAQYRLADFDVIGNRRFAASYLKRYFQNERGGLLSGLWFGDDEAQSGETPVFNRVAFEDATSQLQQLYRNHGYLYAQIEPVIERTETDGGEPAVRIAWRISEGQPAYVNRVRIAGNTYTHERVIRQQILLLPGDIYNEQRLIQSYRRIASLGFFETPLAMPDIEPTDSGTVNVTFHVKEKQTGSINFGTALGGIGGIAGFLGYSQPNLFGQGKSGQIRLEFGRYRNNIQASYRDPAILQSRVSGAISVFSRQNTRFFQFRGGDYRRTGGSLRFGFPLPFDRWTRLQLGYALVQTSYSPRENTSSSLFTLPTSTRSSITLGLVRNTLNHPLFPTVGTRQEIEAQFSGGVLGGDGNYQKYTASGSWYVPVGEIGGDEPGGSPIRFTLGLTAEVGALVGNARRFPFERFFMGGVRFGQTLRGYEERTITPLGYVPPPGDVRGVPLRQRLGNAYLRLGAEYAVRLNDRLSLSFFYDAGNIWRGPADINPTQLFRGAGVGLTLVTPFGPLGLDYAYGFDKLNPGWQLHFKLGPTF